jgi:hypothetical protein
MGKKPRITSNIPETSLSQKIPQIKDRPAKKRWTFSFAYWKQIDCFGLKCEKVNEKWFASLLERLSEVSKLNIDDVFNDHSDSIRFHSINWAQKNIPIQKNDLTWLPSDYLKSEEIEFYQFQISISSGRVVGFFDLDYVFHVVLLDPMHNSQPAKFNNYKVDKTEILETTYTDLLNRLCLIKSKIENHCSKENCEVLNAVGHIQQIHDNGKYVFIDDQLFEEIQYFSAEHQYDDIFLLLVDAMDALREKIATSPPSDFPSPEAYQ